MTTKFTWPVFKGRVHDVRALELRPEIFRMGYFWGELKSSKSDNPVKRR